MLSNNSSFLFFSLSLIEISPLILLKDIIHLSPVHSKSFEDKSLTKFLSRFSLKEISITFFSNFTRFTFFSSSYLSLASFFSPQISKRFSNEIIFFLFFSFYIWLNFWFFFFFLCNVFNLINCIIFFKI